MPTKTRRERVAESAGHAVRRIGLGFPGTVGPLLVSAGCFLAYRPLGIVVLGGVLWLFDRRIP